MRSSHRWLAPVAGAVLAIAASSSARADGEAALVVQDGSAVRTFCVAFEGEGITGDQLLKAAGQTFDAYGGGSGLALCSIGDRGCEDAGSFTSCFCQCQGGDCTYWAFFTRSYGKNWVYSSLAFNLLKAKDGDVHGWKWGQGGPNSAPSPQDITFDQVCGHAPRGGALQPTLVPAPANTSSAVATSAAAPVSPSPALTAPLLPPVTAKPDAVEGETRVPLVTIAGGTQAPPPAVIAPVTSGGASGDDRPANKSLVAFTAVASLLVVAIGGAAIWRRRRG